MNHKGNQQGYNDSSWGGQNVRKSYDNYHQSNNRGGDYQNQNQQHHDGGKFEQRMQSLRLDNERSSKGSSSGGEQQQQQQSSGPKKMTWATIASQPAKPQVSTISTTIKKKGPGMPPPPIIPGKHSLELNDSWDTPKNGPLVPPSPPVITAPPAIDLSSLEKQNNSNYDGQPAWPTIDQAGIQSNAANLQQGSSQAQQQQPSQQHHQPPPSRGYNQYNNNNNNSGNSGSYHRGQYNQNNSAPSHYNNHSNYNNDNYKPYHQNPHQMPTAPTSSSSQNQSSTSSEYRERMPRNMHQPSQNQQQPPQQQQHHQQQPRHVEPAPQVVAISAPAPQASSAISSANASNNDYNKKITDENVLEQLRGKNQYNPSELDLSQVENARFFVIKSYSEDDIHRSIKYEIWCSTEHGNKRLDQAFRERERENGIIYLFFSVNSSGHFCGVAQMMTSVDYNSNSSVWSQDKWKGSFRVKWIYVKDVPNTQLRHIRLENNENKPVTNSRDTQEVPNEHGVQIMKIVHAYKHTTSIFDDFTHYEKRQEEEDTRKHESNDSYQSRPMTLPASHHSTHNRENANRQQQQYGDNSRGYDRGGDRQDRDRGDYSNGGGYDRGSSYNNNGGGSYNKYGSGSGGYNNDYKPSFNGGGGRGGGGGYQKRNDFRNNGDQPRESRDRDHEGGGGFYRANNNDDFGNRGGYRSDRGGSSRGRGGGYRPQMNN